MKKVGVLLLAVSVISGCGYQAQRDILKENVVSNARVFEASRKAVYNAFIRTALLKNFIIIDEDQSAGRVSAERHIEKGSRTYIVTLQARVFAERPGSASLFLNASERRERTYVTDKTRFFLFIIPLPGGGGKEVSHAVESVKAVRDRKFYNDLFKLVEENIVDEPIKAEIQHEMIMEETPSMSEKEVKDEK